MTNPSLSKYLPTKSDEDGLLDGFLKWAEDSEIDLYPAQEEAVLEFFGGQHVILTTPTGSGKSLVATAAHFDALANNKRLSLIHI